MSKYCLLVEEDQIEDVVKELGVKDVVFVPLYDTMFSMDKFKRLGIEAEDDNEIFENSISMMKAKVVGTDAKEGAKKIIESVFYGERHYKLLYDYKKAMQANKSIVFIMSKKYSDKSAKGNSKGSFYLTEFQLQDLMETMCDIFRKDEGMPLTLFEDFKLSGNIDTEADYQRFRNKQEDLMNLARVKEDKENLKRFKKELQYRALAFYSQLRFYDFDKITDMMIKSGYDMSELEGHLIDEEQLRVILAKRTATRSMKNDIVELCKRGIMSLDEINYEI